MFSWLAPRVPPRRYRIDLNTLILDNGKSKVAFSHSEDRALRLRPGLQLRSHDVEDLHTTHSLLVYNSLPPAPKNQPFESNSSLCPPFHIHLREDETFRVLSGEARFLLVDQENKVCGELQDAMDPSLVSSWQDYGAMGIVSRIVPRGSSITIPRGQIHTFRNASTTSNLELEFGFSSGGLSIQAKDTQSWKSIQALGMHVAPTNFSTKVLADHCEPSTLFSAETATNAKAEVVKRRDLDSDSDLALSERSTDKRTSELIAKTSDKTSVLQGQIIKTFDSERLNDSLSKTDPPSKVNVQVGIESETRAISPHIIATKMYRFFLNTQLYRSDCAAHSIPRTLPQLLLFNHAADVVLVPQWLLRSRMLRPFASTIGRMMNILIGVVYGGWICGLKDTYREYSKPASLDVMIEQAERSVLELATDIGNWEAQVIREREGRIRSKEVEESGLVCSAWKSHEFDGQDESWRKDV